MDSEAGAELSFVRLDVEAGRKAPGFDPVALQLCRNSVRADWRPCLKHAKLAGRDADASWRYRNQVFHPRMSFPGGDDYVRGSLLLVVSGRAGGRLEAVARVGHGFRTTLLTPRAPGRGRPPLRPEAAYLDTVVTAPWNRADLPGCPPPLEGLGTLLLLAAVRLSSTWGTQGRLALEPAELAYTWYEQAFPGAAWSANKSWIEVDAEPARVFRECNRPVWALVETLLNRNRWKFSAWSG